MRQLFQTIRIILLLFCSLLAVFPLIWMMLSGVSDALVRFGTCWNFSGIHFDNFRYVLTDSPVPHYIVNSLGISTITAIYQVFTGALLSYALIFFTFRGKKYLHEMIYFTYMLPSAATYIPSYILLSRLHLLNTYQGLIFSQAVSLFGIFLLMQCFREIPKELIDAAKMDGANDWHILWNVVYPVSESGFLTFFLMSFITLYNNYMWPALITTDPKLYQVSQGVRSFFIDDGAYGTKWPLIMAADTIVILPLIVLYIVASRWIMRGITGDSGIKG